ncbi:MAG: GtrA family protein [Arenimonas sp.]
MRLPHDDKLRFLVAGSATTLATYSLYWALLLVLDPRAAYAIACVSGIALSYSLSSVWVFRRRWTHAGLMAFALGYGLQILVSYGVFLLVLAYTPVPAWLAPVLVTIVLLPLTFLMNRELVHRTSPHPGSPTEPPR